MTSLDELLAQADHREPMAKAPESLSGSPFERVVIDGRQYVLKHLSPELDWVMRATDDVTCRVATMWRTGLLDRLPACIDHTIEAVAYNERTARAAVLMRDVGARFVDMTATALPIEQHLCFLDHMAAMHTAFWGFRDSADLCTPYSRYTALGPAKAAAEVARGTADRVPNMIRPGWAALAQAAPQAHDYALALATDPAPLAAALAETPQTLVHGDWKAGNLGSHPDGRTILVDWAWPGQSGGCVDLAWYLAVNCDLLPRSKEATIDGYREALERRGMSTAGWFDRQLELALLGAFVQLGWSKPANPTELSWWVERTRHTANALLS